MVLHARYERSWAAMMKKRSGDRIKKCNGQANIFFSGGAFSPQPVHSGSCRGQLPDALFRKKKAPLQVCELDTTLIPLLMRFSQRLIVDGAETNSFFLGSIAQDPTARNDPSVFSKQAAAMKAYIDLADRFFGGRTVWVAFFPEPDFDKEALAPSDKEPR